MSASALKSLEDTMRKLETAMKSPPKSPKKTPHKRRTPPKRKPPSRSGKKTARKPKQVIDDFLTGDGLGSVKSLQSSMKFMEKERMEYRNALMIIKEILEDDQDANECLKIINTVL